jgi:gamma-glutamyl:cysteine ligase YbdK (ATP-grasp superfamily)
VRPAFGVTVPVTVPLPGRLIGPLEATSPSTLNLPLAVIPFSANSPFVGNREGGGFAATRTWIRRRRPFETPVETMQRWRTGRELRWRVGPTHASVAESTGLT